MKKTFLIHLFTLLTISETILSQHLSISDTINIDEIVVTGSRTSVSRSMMPMTVSVVSREKIDNSSESALLPVLSAQVPGMFVTERGITGFGVASGSAGQISIRGVGGSPNTQVLVLVDGNPQFMGIMGHPLPDTYVASDAEKVEVIRGSASTLYGTNAMGGVINIITKEQAEDGFTASGRLMYGSYDTRKYMAGAGYRHKKFNAYASFNHDETNGHRSSSDFRINNGYMKSGYEINRNLSLTANISIAGFKATDPGLEGGMAGNSYDITRGMAASGFTNKYERTEGSIRVYYNFGKHRISDGFQSNDNNLGIIAYQSLMFLSGSTVTLGTDYKNYGGVAENVFAGMNFADTTIKELAGYFLVKQELSDQFVLNAGFRLEHNSIFGFQPVPSFGATYSPSSYTTVKTSVSRGFRSPTIRELYMWGPANDALVPETMMNYEAGIMQRLNENRLSLEFTVFNVNGKNLIQTLMTPQGPKNLNAGSFSNTGIEFAGTFRPVEELSVNLTYSYTTMKEPVLASPRQHLNINGTYRLKIFTLHLALQHVDNLYTQVNPTVAKESYTLLNSRLSCKVSGGMNIFLKGENLTGKKYYINYGYPMPGLIVFGGINLNI
jgi:outer membrane cobalamin receptor